MFPRVTKSTKNGTSYEYLVISESIRKKGKGSTTRNIANLGNIKNFSNQDISNLIDGFIKIFKLENFCLSDGVEILESLEHGSIIFWQKIWQELDLSKAIKKLVRIKNKRARLAVGKYVEMMVVNRCGDPLSKLGVTRWIERTCYKEMKEYSELPLDVTYFYRSMDHLLEVKDDLEFAIFEKLNNLFSINIKLTFYDITSTFFYSDTCPISSNGYSRDNRPDKVQIVIGVVTSYEGYPIKHFVFEGNTKDETTVNTVVQQLKHEYNIEETTFVGDRGMITKLNLSRLEGEGFEYIMGVKHRQDEICNMLISEQNLGSNYETYNGLKIRERKVKVKTFLIWKSKKIIRKHCDLDDERFLLLEKELLSLNNKSAPKFKEYKNIFEGIVERIEPKISNKVFRGIKKYQGKYEDELRYIICLNEERKRSSQKKREEYILRFSKELDGLFSKKDIGSKDRAFVEIALHKIFEGYKAKFKKFFTIEKDPKTKKAFGYRLNQEALDYEINFDGIFVLLSNRSDLEPYKIVESYKNLKEVETLFDDLKNFVDIRPIRHWLEKRVRAHVFICILSLLLKRVFEINYLDAKAVTEPLEEISKSKLIKYKVKFSKREDRIQIIPKITTTSPIQKQYFKMVGIKNPMNLEKFVW